MVPAWLDKEQWKALVSEAVQMGRDSDWLAVARGISNEPKWIATGSRCAPLDSNGRTCLYDRCYRKLESWGDTPESVEQTPIS